MTYDPEVLALSKEFRLRPATIEMLRKARNKERVVWRWTKQGLVGFPEFEKLLRYLVEH